MSLNTRNPEKWRKDDSLGILTRKMATSYYRVPQYLGYLNTYGDLNEMPCISL